MPTAARTGTPCLPQIDDTFMSTGVLCSGQAGFKLWQVAAPLTTAQLMTVCLTGTCLQLTKELQQIAGDDDCVTTDSFFLYQDILNPILKLCSEAKVAMPTLPPSNSGAQAPTTSASTGHARTTGLVATVLAVTHLVLIL